MDTGDAIFVETWFFAVDADTVALIPWNSAVGAGIFGYKGFSVTGTTKSAHFN